MSDSILSIGTDVVANGHPFWVIANERESVHGYCPEGSVILRNSKGSEIVVPADECEIVSNNIN